MWYGRAGYMKRGAQHKKTRQHYQRKIYRHSSTKSELHSICPHPHSRVISSSKERS